MSAPVSVNAPEVGVNGARILYLKILSVVAAPSVQ